MTFWTIRILVVVTAVALIAGYGRLRRYLAFLRLRRQTGCLYPPRYPHTDLIFGHDLYRRRKRALEEGYHMRLYEDDMQQLGRTWEEVTLGKRTINVADPVNYLHVHSTAVEDFQRLVNRHSNSAVLGSGIYLAEGERWKRSRSLINPIFVKAEDGNMAILEHHVDRFIEQLPTDGSTFDAQPMLKRLALDLTTEFLLGESIGAQEGDPKAAEFLKTFDQVLLGWNKRRQAGSMAVRYMFDGEWSSAIKRLYAFLDDRVKRVLAETELVKGSKREEEESHPNGRYILLPQLAKHLRDPIALRFELLNVFIPGRDTTSALFGNMFWVLSRHPKVWKELRQEVFWLDITTSVSKVDLSSMLSLRNVVYETLRAIGPSGRQFRVAQRDTVLPRGAGPDGLAPTFVARGTIVCTVAHCVHHDTAIWGPDAHEFRPSRWTEDATTRPPWSFVPFIGGPHACPAQQEVVNQGIYILYRMLQKFETLECRDEVHEYIERQHMVIESRCGVQIALTAGERIARKALLN